MEVLRRLGRKKLIAIGAGGVVVVAIVCCALTIPLGNGAEPETRAPEVALDTPATQTPYPTYTPLPTHTPGPTYTPYPSPTPEPTATPTLEFERTEALVVGVTDGDTIDVEIGGQVYSLRYIGIDCPETVDPDGPEQWMGAEATEANRRLVDGQTVYLESDTTDKDRYGRLLRYVFLADGTCVNEELVRLGYARSVAYEPDLRMQSTFDAAQGEAQDAGRGLWGPTPEPPTAPPTESPPQPTEAPAGVANVVVSPDCCQFNSPGDDNHNKEEEWVCFLNAGDGPADMTGWKMHDEYGWTFEFPAFVLQPGVRVRVATGCGPRSDILYWCHGGDTAVWNNGGDTVYLYDAADNPVTTYGY